MNLSPFVLPGSGVFCDTILPDNTVETSSLQHALADAASKDRTVANASSVLTWMYQNLDFRPRA